MLFRLTSPVSIPLIVQVIGRGLPAEYSNRRPSALGERSTTGSVSTGSKRRSPVSAFASQISPLVGEGIKLTRK
jgi:hypothetical protein